MSTPTTTLTAPANAELIKAVRDHAKANYETGGWSFIVEAWSDEDIAKAIGLVKTPAGAIKKLAPVMAALAERAGMKDEKPAKAKVATAPKVARKCKCSCGGPTTKVYAQGHDARHVSQLKAAVIAGKMTRDQAAKVLAPADRLVAKLNHSLDLHYEAVRKLADAMAAPAKPETPVQAAKPASKPRATKPAQAQADASSKAA